jgi:class 3 adenylate cyclase
VKESVKIEADNSPRSIFQTVVMCHPDRFEVRSEFGNVEDYNVQVFNPNRFHVQLALERLEWNEDILTAARVTNLQEFRELFEAQVISPHEQISVGSQVVVFTDLRGSTAMYNRVGDAPAYGLVRNHFYVLAQAVSDHHGAIVKTIGDAVMAVFSRIDEALAAVQQMHEKLPTANPNPAINARLILKSSLHCGPCLAVNANDKLDFFGSTINLAARMVDSCKGDDLVVSEEVHQRPELQTFLEQLKVRAEPSEITFRGFDTPQKIWRIPMTHQAALTPFFQARVRQSAPV